MQPTPSGAAHAPPPSIQRQRAPVAVASTGGIELGARIGRRCLPLILAVCLVVQFPPVFVVFLFLASFGHRLDASLQSGAGCVVPSEDYSHGPPAISPLCSKATTETKQERKYTTLMKTDSNFQTNDKANQRGTQVQAQSRSENVKQKRYALFLNNECYGFVHASSEREALDRVAGFKKPFTARLSGVQD